MKSPTAPEPASAGASPGPGMIPSAQADPPPSVKRLLERAAVENNELESILNLFREIGGGEDSVLNLVPVAMALLDGEGFVLAANRLAVEVMGGHPASTASSSKSDLAAALAAASRSSDVVRNVEVISTFPDGVRRTFLWSAAPLRDSDRMTIGAFVVGRDITNLKVAEDRLSRSNAELAATVRERTAELGERAALLELSFDAIMVRDPLDRVTYWNRGAEEMYGWNREEVLGRVTHELFQTQFPEPLAVIQDKIRRHGRWSGELVHRTREGARLVVATRWAVRRDTEGKLAAILESNTDITDRKEAEEALRRREQELAAFFEDSPISLLWVCPEGRILKANRALLSLLGVGPKQIRDARIGDFTADIEGLQHLLARLKNGETVRNYCLRFRTWHSRLLYVSIDANAFQDSDRMVYSRWLVQDITRRIELEQEILAISEREQRRLGHDLHDDLCQFLTGIEFLSQTLASSLEKSSSPDVAKAKEIAVNVRLATVKARDLARGLSTLGMEAEGLMVALRELAERTSKFFGNCTFVCRGRVLVKAEVVGVHLYRIAQEAVSNAVKHGQATRIEIRLTPFGRGLRLEIADDGTGIASVPAQAKGMGLRIMRYRAEVIGGRIFTHPGPDQRGTVVACEVADLSAILC